MIRFEVEIILFGVAVKTGIVQKNFHMLKDKLLGYIIHIELKVDDYYKYLYGFSSNCTTASDLNLISKNQEVYPTM